MSEEYDKVRGDRGFFSKYVHSTIYFTTGGDLGVLLSLKDPANPGIAGDTVGSALLSETDKIRSIIRGVECGMVAMLRWEMSK